MKAECNLNLTIWRAFLEKREVCKEEKPAQQPHISHFEQNKKERRVLKVANVFILNAADLQKQHNVVFVTVEL